MVQNTMIKSKYNWKNHATVEELSTIFGVTKRRVQQVLKEMDSLGLIEVNHLLLEVEMVSHTYVPYKIIPCYKRVDLHE